MNHDSRVLIGWRIGSDLRSRISSPFDFQHLTHTERQQFNSLRSPDHSELAAEFAAASFSQHPTRELTGIHADDLHSNQLAATNLPASHASSEDAAGHRSNFSLPRLSPQRSYERSLDDSPSPTSSRKGGLRQSRSVDSFSQPKIRSAARISGIANPPPRRSSRQALFKIEDADNDTVDGEPILMQNPRFVSKRASGFWQSPPLPTQRFVGGNGLSAIVAKREDTFAHAVTTPGDAAVQSLSPTFALENVPEEPESYFNPRPAPTPTPRTPTFEEPRSLHSSRPSGAFAWDSGLSRQATIRASQPVSPRTQLPMELSHTLGPAFSPKARNYSPQKFASLRRQSILQEFDASWEDDIDYCYDHAAEADCDYDWGRKSFEFEDVQYLGSAQRSRLEESSPVQHGLGLCVDEEEPLQKNFLTKEFRASLLVPHDVIPELVPTSSQSVSTPNLLTPPSDSREIPEARTPYHDSDGYPFQSSLLLSQDGKFQALREDIYDDLLAEYQSSEKHYPFLDAAQSIAGSSLSSAARFSKRSSYDSSIRSGSASLHSSVRRSASSAGSLPDLIHSRRSTRHMMDKTELIVESFTSAHLGDDDNNSNRNEDDAASLQSEGTPTNSTEQGKHASSERTFFSEDEEKLPTEAQPKEIEDGKSEQVDEANRKRLNIRPATPPLPEKVSLELEIPPLPSFPASASTILHERAASDSTAKLLSFSTGADMERQKTRQRSASHSQTRRSRRTSAYTLSLFPKPTSPTLPTRPPMSP